MSQSVAALDMPTAEEEALMIIDAHQASKKRVRATADVATPPKRAPKPPAMTKKAPPAAPLADTMVIKSQAALKAERKAAKKKGGGAKSVSA